MYCLQLFWCSRCIIVVDNDNALWMKLSLAASKSPFLLILLCFTVVLDTTAYRWCLKNFFESDIVFFFFISSVAAIWSDVHVACTQPTTPESDWVQFTRTPSRTRPLHLDWQHTHPPPLPLPVSPPTRLSLPACLSGTQHSVMDKLICHITLSPPPLGPCLISTTCQASTNRWRWYRDAGSVCTHHPAHCTPA